MLFTDINDLKTKLEMTALARGMDEEHSIVITINNVTTNNQPIRFVVGYSEPTGTGLPLNVLWFVLDPQSSHFNTILRRISRSPQNGFVGSWLMQESMNLLLTTPQVWDQPIPAYQDLFDHVYELGDPHNSLLETYGDVTEGTGELITEPETTLYPTTETVLDDSGGTMTGALNIRPLADVGDDYGADEAVPRSWIELMLDQMRSITENIIQSFANINSQIDNLRTRVEILEQSLLGVKGYLFNAASASLTWTINHNMNNVRVIVQAYEDDKVVLPADIQVVDANNVVITFAEPVVGYAQVLPVIEVG